MLVLLFYFIILDIYRTFGGAASTPANDSKALSNNLI